MQVPPSATQPTVKEELVQNPFNRWNIKVKKPIFWLVIGVFLIMSFAGYWIGSTMVLQAAGSEITFANTLADTGQKTYLLLETDDLSLKNPQLISIWFIHLFPEDKPRLGFSPVVSLGEPENEQANLLKEFTLDDKRNPSRDFLQAVSKKGFHTQNFILVDKTSAAALINWFAGKELTEPIAVEMHTMVQYGQALRGLCASFALPSERGVTDFPWSKIAPNHFRTSLQFDTVIENLAFLTAPVQPHCEMVPLP